MHAYTLMHTQNLSSLNFFSSKYCHFQIRFSIKLTQYQSYLQKRREKGEGTVTEEEEGAVREEREGAVGEEGRLKGPV